MYKNAPKLINAYNICKFLLKNNDWYIIADMDK